MLKERTSTHKPWLPFYYGWVNVVLAAVAMTATLPARTHGLGLITEQILADLQISPVDFSTINLFATLVGASFCLGIGTAIDRIGTRAVSTVVIALLGGSVCAMSQCQGPITLLITLTLTRGFGQSALSIVSMSIVGKWFRRNVGAAMGVYAVLIAVGFIAATLLTGKAVEGGQWRSVWNFIGLCLLTFSPVCLLLVRSAPTSVELVRFKRTDEFSLSQVANAAEDANSVKAEGYSLFQRAIRSSTFWAFALGTALFNAIWSAITLFYESILGERGLADHYVNAMAALTGAGLIANLVAGWMANHWSLSRLLAVGLALLSVLMLLYPFIDTPLASISHAAGMGVAGGIVTVIFFSAWGKIFGTTQLGRIQSSAQMLTVLASASGPLVLASSRQFTGASTCFFALASLLAFALAIWLWFLKPFRCS